MFLIKIILLSNTSTFDLLLCFVFIFLKYGETVLDILLLYISLLVCLLLVVVCT